MIIIPVLQMRVLRDWVHGRNETGSITWRLHCCSINPFPLSSLLIPKGHQMQMSLHMQDTWPAGERPDMWHSGDSLRCHNGWPQGLQLELKHSLQWKEQFYVCIPRRFQYMPGLARVPPWLLFSMFLLSLGVHEIRMAEAASQQVQGISLSIRNREVLHLRE